MIALNYRISGIESIEFGRNLIDEVLPNSLIIADENTSKFVPNHLHTGNKIIVLHKPLPTKSLALKLLKYTTDIDKIVAVGSGTITDICKYLAYISGKDYIIFPTAPSVNAYTSPSASIFDFNGKKTSTQAKMPKAIYIDTEIISNAPKRLILSGLYDLICSVTVKADCFLSHILTGGYYNELFFDLISPYEKELITYYKYLGDSKLTTLLMEALILSGFGMFAYGNSNSASQSEHIIAHALEERYRDKFFHGEYVATGLLIASQLQETLFKSKLKISDKRLVKYQMLKKVRFIDKLEEAISSNLDKLNSLIANHWRIRDFIVNSNITLPNANSSNNLISRFISKSKFTCLDLFYLSGKYSWYVFSTNQFSK